jgi:hypothetical protein
VEINQKWVGEKNAELNKMLKETEERGKKRRQN